MEKKLFNHNKLRNTISKAIEKDKQNTININIYKYLYLLQLNPYKILSTQILNIKQEGHNLFGEKKPYLKIKKRGKIGIRAQLRKETPNISLKDFYEEELEQQKNVCEKFLDLKQINILERFSRILHINKINFICRNIDKLNKKRILRKKRTIVRKILQKIPYYSTDLEEKDNIIAFKQENYAQRFLKMININLKSKKETKKQNKKL